MLVGHNAEPGGRVKTEPVTGLHDSDQIEHRLAVAPKRAWRMLDIGATRGYELLAAGELESYVDGRSRRITVASIESFIARRLAASASGELRRDLVEPAVQGRKQRRSRRRAVDNVNAAEDADGASRCKPHKKRLQRLRGDQEPEPTWDHSK